MKESFALKNKSFFERGIKELAEGWLLTMRYDRVYFEFLAAFVVTRIKQINYLVWFLC